MHIQWFLVQFVSVGLLLIAVGAPFILSKIPPNRFYGYRVEKTLSKPEIWYLANRYMGWAYLVAGVVMIITGLALNFFAHHLSYNAVMAIFVTAMVASASVASIMSIIHLRTL